MRRSVASGAVLIKKRVRSAQEEPVPDAIDARTHLVQSPLGTLSGFPVAQVLSEEGADADASFAEGFVVDLNAALVKQFLDTPITQG